jgi:hypothetical protein
MPSFSLDLTQMLTLAAQMFNQFAPILLIGAGIAVGLGLAIRVVGEIRRAF